MRYNNYGRSSAMCGMCRAQQLCVCVCVCVMGIDSVKDCS